MKHFVEPGHKRPMKQVTFARNRDRRSRRRITAEIRSKMEEAVQEWWHKCLSTGVIMEDASLYQPNRDYRGDLPWPSAISRQVLHIEFSRTTTLCVSPDEFWRFLRACTSIKSAGYASYRDYHAGRYMGTKHTQLYFLSRDLTE